MKKLIFIYTFLLILIWIPACASAPPVVTGETLSAEISRDYDSLSKDELVSIVKKYDTARPAITVSKKAGVYSVTAKVGERTVSKEFTDYANFKTNNEWLNFRTVTLFITLILIASVLYFFRFWMWYRYKSRKNKFRT